MKISAMSVVGFTTMVLVTVTIMVSMNFPFNWVFYMTIFGQALVVYMVYKVLTDDYDTPRTFEDFYEDYPIGREDRFR
jgi:hypothetical protein